MDIWQNVLVSLASCGAIAALLDKRARKVCKEEISNSVKDFTTKEELQVERERLLNEVERKFLTIYAFREFEKRIDENFKVVNRRFEDSSKRFDKLDDGIEHIKDLIIGLKG